MIRWEYFVARYSQAKEGWRWSPNSLSEMGLEDALKHLGEQGWELVTALNEDREGTTESSEYIFKRPANSPIH